MGAVDELRKRVRQSAGADVVDRQDRIAVAETEAGVDHLLRAALDLRIAALDGVEIELDRVRTCRERAGRTAAHADAHARATELHEQRAGRELDLLRLLRGDRAEPAGNHDRLVIAAPAASHRLLEDAEVAGQVGPSELVVEGGAAERAFDHDLQRAGDVIGLAVGLALPRFGSVGTRQSGQSGQVQVRDRKAREAGLRLGAAAGRTFIADLAAGTGGGTRERRDRGRVVVRLDLHQHVRQRLAAAVAARLGAGVGLPVLHDAAFHDRGVVAVGDDRVLRRCGFARADHLEHRSILGDAVDRESGVEDLVPAVLAVGLREHRQLDIAGLAAERAKRGMQIGQLVVGQGQAETAVDRGERLAVVVDADPHQGLGGALVEQVRQLGAAVEHAFGHAVVQQRRDLRALPGAQRLRAAEQSALQAELELGDALDPMHGQAAVAGDVGGLRSPRRDRAQARCDDQRRVGAARLERIAVAKQGFDPFALARGERCVAPDDVQVAGADRFDPRGCRTELAEQRESAEFGEGIAALDLVQLLLAGHRAGPKAPVKTRDSRAPVR